MPPDRKRILVAEDDPSIRALVAHRLYTGGYEVLPAADGDEALALALEQRPDAAVIDVMMPGLNGYELTRALRADDRTRAMPIIVLSARAGRADAQFALRQGANAFLLKPFQWPDLKAALEAALA